MGNASRRVINISRTRVGATYKRRNGGGDGASGCVRSSLSGSKLLREVQSELSRCMSLLPCDGVVASNSVLRNFGRSGNHFFKG